MALLPISAIVFLIAFLFLLAIKTIHFFKNIRYKKIKYWFYFDKAHIINSSNELSEKAKKQQNTLTVALAVILILECIMMIMIYKSN